jgi:hypothetical protein
VDEVTAIANEIVAPQKSNARRCEKLNHLRDFLGTAMTPGKSWVRGRQSRRLFLYGFIYAAVRSGSSHL